MSRQERNSVDYFPFICKEGKAMYYIENKYSNDGFATWIKILRQLAVTNFHYIDLSNKIDLMYLASKCKVSEEVLESIISDLSELDEFNKDLWNENKVIWSQKFINNINDAYKKRNNKCITFDGLLILLDSLGVRKLPKRVLKVPDNTHIKEEYTKEEKRKEKNGGYIISSYEQIFDKWLKYKSNRKEKYKDEDSIKSAYDKIVRLSEGDHLVAEKIVDESMSNNWAGLFELKESDYKKIKEDKNEPDLFNGVKPLENNDF